MKIAVCDDEKTVCELIVEKLKKLYPHENIISYKSGQEVLDDKSSPDILFLDIQMQGINGMETARKLRLAGKNIIIIFVTALEEYVFEAFDVDAFHYLVKPFSDEKFAQVLQSAVSRLKTIEKPSKKLMITAGGKHISINIENIIYAEVYDRKIIIHMPDDDVEYYGKMKELEKEVGDEFYRTHRAYLVNFNFIRKYDATVVYMEKGQAPIAKQSYHEFVKSYMHFVRQGVE